MGEDREVMIPVFVDEPTYEELIKRCERERIDGPDAYIEMIIDQYLRTETESIHEEEEPDNGATTTSIR